MEYTLTRTRYADAGIFGELRKDGEHVAFTLEHAYPDGDDFVPKVAEGTYTCVRHAPNRLPYETFEVTAVPDFQGEPVAGILIHCGNFDRDSAGCVLVGAGQTDSMVTESKKAFAEFMSALDGVDEFSLTISKA